MLNIDEINEYYIELGIKPCWDLDSLTIEELNEITNTFDQLHKIYPDVVIEEIGDYYSFDKVSRENDIIFNKEIYETHSYAKHEVYINEPEKLKEFEEYFRKLVKDMERNEVNVDDEKYDNMTASAKYSSSNKCISFNHRRVNHESLYIANDLVCHEFGHAVASQYGLNEDADINLIFNSDKERIELLTSEYGQTNIDEFIAETFCHYYGTVGIMNLLIVEVMDIIIKKVSEGKVMSATERWKEEQVNKYLSKDI
ncbi:hypothetical protein [Clostridium sp. CF012]|uniref:hypothetical protein n=1 Tax=Clostridium sp. CF012 TaxID=2843319 RepID=UPI001C0C98D7|nr:hypothetical protein [Clostridium sp. CF012]MBU3142228.1 hypothetical protein [Clostridium sp. CF012]